jgi:hypothetical protein
MLNKDVIKKLALDFCKLDKSELSDDALQARKKSRPIARARISAANQGGEEENAQEQILAKTRGDLL